MGKSETGKPIASIPLGEGIDPARLNELDLPVTVETLDRIIAPNGELLGNLGDRRLREMGAAESLICTSPDYLVDNT